MKTPAHIVPEWYFLPFYAILRSIPDLIGGVVAMGASVLIFAALPYLDRSTIPAGARYRPVYRAMFFVFALDVVALGYIGAQPPSDDMLFYGRLASLLYFSLFFLLPSISVREDRWLRKRGLPKAVEAFIEAEQAEIARSKAVRRARRGGA